MTQTETTQKNGFKSLSSDRVPSLHSSNLKCWKEQVKRCRVSGAHKSLVLGCVGVFFPSSFLNVKKEQDSFLL